MESDGNGKATAPEVRMGGRRGGIPDEENGMTSCKECEVKWERSRKLS